MGALVAIIGEFIVFYPNIAALPMPSTIFNAYQGFLPTYLYPFQFPVNTDPVPADADSSRPTRTSSRRRPVRRARRRACS